MTGNLSNGELPTLDEAKAHLRVDFSDDDNYITSIISAAREYIQDYCGVTFGAAVGHTAYWDYAYPVVNVHWNGGSIVTSSDNSPVLSQLIDGSYVAVSEDNYDLDFVSSPLRVHMKSLGDAAYTQLNNYRLSFSTNTQTIPDYVKQASLMVIGHYYENRQDVGKERIFEVPMNSKFLLDRYRKQAFT